MNNRWSYVKPCNGSQHPSFCITSWPQSLKKKSLYLQHVVMLFKRCEQCKSSQTWKRADWPGVSDSEEPQPAPWVPLGWESVQWRSFPQGIGPLSHEPWSWVLPPAGQSSCCGPPPSFAGGWSGSAEEDAAYGLLVLDLDWTNHLNFSKLRVIWVER